jgi:hypothetical protein
MRCSLHGKAGGAVAHQAARADAGVSRMLLWWAWAGGAAELQRQLITSSSPGFSGGVRSGVRAAAAALATACGLCRARTDAAVGAGADGGKEPADKAAAAAAAAPKTLQPEAPVPVLDGLTATLLDEAMLRGEPLLKPYWDRRHAMQASCAAYVSENQQLLEVRSLWPQSCRATDIRTITVVSGHQCTLTSVCLPNDRPQSAASS